MALLGDPLALLRGYVQRGRFEAVTTAAPADAAAAAVPGGQLEVQFPDEGVAFPVGVPTAFREERGAGPHYTLGAIYFAYAHRGSAPSTYIKAAHGAGVKRVGLNERRDVVSYLEGTVASSTSVDAVAPAPVLPGSKDAAAAAAAAAAAGSTAAAAAAGSDASVSSSSSAAAAAAAGGGGGGASSLAPSSAAAAAAAAASSLLGSTVPGLLVPDDAGEAEALRAVLAREEGVSSRNSVLQSERRDFATVVADVARQLRRDEAAAARRAAAAASASSSSSGSAAGGQRGRQGPRHDRYQDVEDGKHTRERLGLGDDLADLAPLDARGGGGSGAAKSASAAAAAAAAAGSRRGRGEKRARAETSSSSGSRSSSSAGAAAGGSGRGDGPGGSGPPIILVPAAAAAMICLPNVVEVLDTGRYISAVEAKKAAVASGTATAATLGRGGERTVEHNGQVYRIANDPTKLSPAEWERVIAVFVLGQAWQFRSFPWTDPVQIFSRIAGFYPKRDDDPKVPEAVEGWNCHVLNINCGSRQHVTATAIRDFWSRVEARLDQKRRAKAARI